MPRETVRPQHLPHTEYVTPLPSISVGWHKETGGSVQVGLEANQVEGQEQQTLVDYLHGQHTEQIGLALFRFLEEIGRVISDDQSDPENEAHQVTLSASLLGRLVLDAVNTTDANVTPGWFTHLDRFGINSLIRILRKARDGAFGRDE